jgi:hypothetical protein
MEWDFPPNGGGETDGFNNSSIDTFIGRRVFSLVRETIQNSMDAKAFSDKPVRVSFTLDEVAKNNAKGMPELLPFLSMATKTANNQHGSEHPGTRFFKRASEILLNSKSITFFGIHDFETTGLTGPTESRESKPGAWLALVKGSGLSIKNTPGSLGSFGHGSKAPFAISQIRTVFYFSKVRQSSSEELRFQGKSILQSMEMSNGEMTQGTGYFGHKNRCMPLIDREIPEWAIHLRDNAGVGTGTSILVPFPELGSKPDEIWRDIKISILSNFYYAILNGNLEIGLGSLGDINALNIKATLDNLLLELSAAKDENSKDLKEDLRSAITIQYPSIEKHGRLISNTFGEVSWFMRIGQDIEWRTVGVARQNGMLISRRAKNLEKFAGTKPFDMFICVTGENGSQVLRAAENPAHTDFEFDRITDSVDRKKKLKEYSEFTNEIRELIRLHAAIDASAEVFTSDLDDFFAGFNSPASDTGESEKSLDLVVSKPRRPSYLPGSPISTGSEGFDEGAGYSDKGGPKNTSTGGKENNKNSGKTGGINKAVGLEVFDPRIIRKSNNFVEIYFTPSIKSALKFELYRSGESDREAVEFKADNNKEWKSQLDIAESKKIQRIHLKIELQPSELNYVHEVVVYVAN